MSTIKASKAIVQGIKILVFSEAGNLLETVNASPDFLAQHYRYERRPVQWEDELGDQWYHDGKPVNEPDWNQVRRDMCNDITSTWSYETT